MKNLGSQSLKERREVYKGTAESGQEGRGKPGVCGERKCVLREKTTV